MVWALGTDLPLETITKQEANRLFLDETIESISGIVGSGAVSSTLLTGSTRFFEDKGFFVFMLFSSLSTGAICAKFSYDLYNKIKNYIENPEIYMKKKWKTIKN